MPGRLNVLLLLALFTAGCTPPGDVATPDVTARRSPSPSPTQAPSPTPPAASATPTVMPSQTLAPDLNAPEVLDLDVTGCPGGVVVDWSAARHPDFHHYLALRSIEPVVETAYPPIAPAVDWGDSYATDRFVTSAVDATLIPSQTRLYYRVMAYDAADFAVAASPTLGTHLFEVVQLDPIVATPAAEPGATTLDWGMFGGLGRCFTEYRVTVGPVGFIPTTTLTVVSDQSTSQVDTTGLHAGQSYAIGVEAIRSTTLGSFVVGRTEIATYTVP